MQTIRVPTLRDAVAEPVETFTVVLRNPSGTNVVHDTGVGTITDEGLPGLSIADAPTVAEGGEAVFPVTLNPASSQVVTVAYATQDGTAVADSDYTANIGNAALRAGRDDTEHPGGDASRRHRRAERELHSGAE